MGLQEMTVAEGYRFINHEEKEVLQDLFSLCIFLKARDKRDFWTQVTAAAGCTHIDAISEDAFEAAFLKAKSILHARGDEVFNGAKTRLAMRSMQYVRGMRSNGSSR